MNSLVLRHRQALAICVVALGCLVLSTSCGGGASAPLQNGDNLNPAANNQVVQERNGTTSAFGIPAGMEGDVSRGEALYTASCSMCHGSGLGARDYPALTAALSNVKAMASLNLTEQQLADVTAYLNRASIPPVVTPPADPNPPAPPTDPTPPPTTDPAPPTGDSLTGFGIPAGMSGSISGGEQVWGNSCTACHGSMGAKSYGQLQGALTGVGAMRSINLTEQQLADLTAYLNRNAGTGGSQGGNGTVGDDDNDDDGNDDGLDNETDEDGTDDSLDDESGDNSDDDSSMTDDDSDDGVDDEMSGDDDGGSDDDSSSGDSDDEDDGEEADD